MHFYFLMKSTEIIAEKTVEIETAKTPSGNSIKRADKTNKTVPFYPPKNKPENKLKY